MSAVEHPLSSVRLASVDTLRALAQSKDDSGWLARQQLTVLLGDDSRAVAAKASEVLADIDREEHLAAPSYPPGDKTTPPSLPGKRPVDLAHDRLDRPLWNLRRPSHLL